MITTKLSDEIFHYYSSKNFNGAILNSGDILLHSKEVIYNCALGEELIAAWGCTMILPYQSDGYVSPFKEQYKRVTLDEYKINKIENK